MSQRKILLPFGLPPAKHAKSLVESLVMPTLGSLLTRAKQVESIECDTFAKALPHENWLYQQAGGTPSSKFSPKIAHFHMKSLGIPPTSGRWFIINPMHINITREHLIATDTRSLNLTESHSQQLFSLAQTCSEEVGLELLYANQNYWFLRADSWQDLDTATPDAVCGHAIDYFEPQGVQARSWRKLQNEIQMSWHDHPVNQEREQQGLFVINSLWVWGGSDAMTLTLPLNIMVCPQLMPSALNLQWHEWRNVFVNLEATLFAPQLCALLSGEITSLHLTLTNSTRCITYECNRKQQRKFWCKPSLRRLILSNT